MSCSSTQHGAPNEDSVSSHFQAYKRLRPVFIECAKRSTTYDMTSPFTNYTKHRSWVLVKTAYMRQF